MNAIDELRMRQAAPMLRDALAGLLELWDAALMPQGPAAEKARAALAATEGAAPAAPVNGVAANWFHDEGAVACCHYCGRYTMDRAALSDRQPVCACGNKHGWSGSFKKPGPDAQWHGAAPAAPLRPFGIEFDPEDERS